MYRIARISTEAKLPGYAQISSGLISSHPQPNHKSGRCRCVVGAGPDPLALVV
jgi:hypothetical protein